MAYKLGRRSRENLTWLPPEFAEVFYRAIKRTPYDFGIYETIRTPEQQRENIKNGVSWTMDSRHLPDKDGIVYAADFKIIHNGKTQWGWEYYYRVAPVILEAGAVLGIPIEWGGNWKRGRADGPHIQLNEALYKGRY